jgi:ribonuclease HI
MDNHKVAGTSQLHGEMAGESATNSNRVTRALGDVLRRFTQALGCGCRGDPDSPTGEQLKYVLQIFWKVLNNEAEYEALLHGLRLAVSLASSDY